MQGQKSMEFSAAQRVLLADLRRRGGAGWLPVTGISMRPLLREGDEIWIEFAEQPTVEVGDIVFLVRGHAKIAHRLIGRAPDGRWIEKGDFNPRAYLVNPGELAGRVTRRRRKGREIPLNRTHWLERLLLAQSRLRLRLMGRHPQEPA
jgi:hypothetical protein